jgi:hypothetical protein
MEEVPHYLSFSRLFGIQKKSGLTGEQKNLLPFQGIVQRFFRLSVCGLVSTPTKLFWLPGVYREWK